MEDPDLFHLINIKLKHWPDGTSTILLASLISATLQFMFFCELLFMDVSCILRTVVHGCLMTSVELVVAPASDLLLVFQRI
jgi:hypothetical protein